MSAQVSGEPEGVTLLDAITEGRVPTPGELTFPQWQAWRRGPGMRPTVSRDGRGITTAEEVEIWRAVMGHLYGDGRVEALEEEERADEGVPRDGGRPDGAVAVRREFVSPVPSEVPAGSLLLPLWSLPRLVFQD